jgi:ribonuclease P/MRP protein subunit POP1
MPLNPIRHDDTIPVLLIQRSVETSKSTDSQALHGWTLIIPAGWSMAFFSSLVFTNTRVAGQLERQTQAYEAGAPYFPRDYPFNQPYQSYASDREKREKEVWQRKPPAKRVNYEKLGIENPWRAIWETVLGVPEIGDETQEGEVKFVSTQREASQPIGAIVRPWLLRGFDVPNIVTAMSSVFNHAAVLFSEINRLRVKRGHSPLPNSVKPVDILQGALITVKITMCSRGSPKDLAILHSLPDDVYRKWEKVLNIRRAAGITHEQEIPEEAEVDAFV